MAKHIVTCRICKEKFDAQDEEKGISWVMPSKNFYYHKGCYDNWKAQSDVNVKRSDEAYIEYIYDYLARDLKVEYDYYMCEAQRKNYVEKKNYTNKGIFFTLKYFYEIKKGEWEKSHGGLGIIPYVYQESLQYWATMTKKQANIMEEIEAQMAKMTEVVATKKRVRKTPKKYIDRSAELLAEVSNEY